MDISNLCQAFEAKEAAPAMTGSSPFAAPFFLSFSGIRYRVKRISIFVHVRFGLTENTFLWKNLLVFIRR